MLIWKHVGLLLHVITELFHPIHYIVWRQFSAVFCEHAGDVEERIVLIHVCQRYKAVCVWSVVCLKLHSKSHVCSNASVTAHEFVVAPLQVTAPQGFVSSVLRVC